MVNVPGVTEFEAAAVIHGVVVEAAQVVVAPPAVMLMVCGAGAGPEPALNTRLAGVIGSSVT